MGSLYSHKGISENLKSAPLCSKRHLIANETELLLFFIQPWNDSRPHHNNIKALFPNVK